MRKKRFSERAKDSQRERLCIRLDQLQPGDVVLSTYNAPSSYAITRLTAGDYSHAALVIRPEIWFESIGEGIVFSPKFPTYVREGPEGNDEYFLDMSSYVLVDVVRHPELAMLDRAPLDRVADELYSLALQFWGWEYTRPSDLVNLVRRRGMLRGLVETFPRFSRLISRIEEFRAGPDTVASGPWCSALVLLMLEGVGLNVLIRSDITVTNIVPSDLVDPSKTNLYRVKGIVTRVGEGVIDSDEFAPGARAIVEDVRRAMNVSPDLGRLQLQLREPQSNPPGADDPQASLQIVLDGLARFDMSLTLLNEQCDRLIELARSDSLHGRLELLLEGAKRLRPTLRQRFGLNGILRYEAETIVQRAKRSGTTEDRPYVSGLIELIESAKPIDNRRHAVLAKIDTLIELLSPHD